MLTVSVWKLKSTQIGFVQSQSQSQSYRERPMKGMPVSSVWRVLFVEGNIYATAATVKLQASKRPLRNGILQLQARESARQRCCLRPQAPNARRLSHRA
eukprot:361871-Chlamydomonas_euryale.AAC.20